MAGTQRGFTLLVLLLAISVGAAGLLVSAREPGARERARSAAETSESLARARDALLAYALADGYRNPGSAPDPGNIRPGSLPCPDGDQPPDYSADLFAGDACPTYLGRLPHRTLEVIRMRDHEREPLWFALDPQFRDHDNAEPINPATPGNLTINGAGAFVAVILSPGAPLAGQSRADGATAENWLEADNVDADNDFLDCQEVANCNDRARGITAKQLLELVPHRLIADAEAAANSFYADHGYYPWAAKLGDPSGECVAGTPRGGFPVAVGNCDGAFNVRESVGGPVPDWIIDNEWFRYVYYAVANSCAGSGSNCGTVLLTLGGTGDRAVVLAATGVPIVSDAKGSLQDRGGAVPQHVMEHLDSPENTDGDNVFDDPRNGAGENDRLRAIAAP